MIEDQIIKDLYVFFNKFDNKPLNEVIAHVPPCAATLKVSELKGAYKSWRNQYMKSKRTSFMSLEEFCIDKAKNSKQPTDPANIKKAIDMKNKGITVREIERETQISNARLYHIFNEASIRGVKILKKSYMMNEM